MLSSNPLFRISVLLSFIFLMGCQMQQKPAITFENEDDSQLPLIYQMAYIDRYASKLYFAGQEQNWELADMYTHELEEVAETIIESNDTDNGINRSELMETMLIPQIEAMEEAIDAKDRELFNRNYQTLIHTCNKCHSAAEYGMVKITVPNTNPYNQDFSVQDEN